MSPAAHAPLCEEDFLCYWMQSSREAALHTVKCLHIWVLLAGCRRSGCCSSKGKPDTGVAVDYNPVKSATQKRESTNRGVFAVSEHKVVSFEGFLGVFFTKTIAFFYA